ncbi:MAG TPA: hypothetical protein VFU49_20370 [Ktedonobacteraceae bacterium]|nr:hypothetical protein [Ktedonobacteraceae bacterium]
MRTFVWPLIVIISTYLVGLVTFIFPGATVRPLLEMWFLFVCPGIVVVRFLRLRSPAAEWSLIVALSLAVDGIVSGILLYAGKWSPFAILVILMMFCSVGVSIYLFTALMVFFRGGKREIVAASLNQERTRY